MELDPVCERLNCFLTDKVVQLAVEVGPRRCTDLLLDNFVPLKKSGFIQQILVKSKKCCTGLFALVMSCNDLCTWQFHMLGPLQSLPREWEY